VIPTIDLQAFLYSHLCSVLLCCDAIPFHLDFLLMSNGDWDELEQSVPTLNRVSALLDGCLHDYPLLL
jgi:hypothetical protein